MKKNICQIHKVENGYLITNGGYHNDSAEIWVAKDLIDVSQLLKTYFDDTNHTQSPPPPKVPEIKPFQVL